MQGIGNNIIKKILDRLTKDDQVKGASENERRIYLKAIIERSEEIQKILGEES